MRFGHFPGDYGGPLWIHDLFLLIIVVVVILGIYFLVRGVPHRPPWPGPGPRQHWGRPPGRGPRNPAIDELDLRYARGEVDRVEYMQRRADLLGAPPPDDPGGATPGASPQP